MYEHNLTWEEWTERFFAASDYQVDRTGISEKEAEDRHPIFYDSYLNGDEPEDFYCQYFVSHERGEVEIWFDPDDPNYYDEELDAILSNTEFYETFNLEMSNLKLLNNVSINNSATDMDITINQTFRRQIYVGVVTCLETYLSDAFINTVLSNEEYLELFFKTFKFTKPKIDTKDLFKISKNIRDFAGKRMLEVLYHNIEKVKVMYKNTLSVSFPETEKINQYIDNRHDLVHRNGKEAKVKGKTLFLTKEDIDEIISDVKCFVNEIDRQLKEKAVKKLL